MDYKTVITIPIRVGLIMSCRISIVKVIKIIARIIRAVNSKE